MKQRRSLAGLVGLLALSLLVLSCSKAAAPRGWAAPVPLDNLVLVSTSKGHITAINTSSREEVWRFPNCWSVSEKRARTLLGIYGPPIIGRDGTVFLGDYSGYIYAFASKAYSCDKGSARPAVGVFKFDGHIIGGVTLDPASDKLYVASGPHLYSVKSQDLTARIENQKATVELTEVFKAGGDIWSTPVLAGNGILISSLDGNLYMLDAGGRETWRYSAGRSLASTPVVSGGVVLVGGFDGELHAVDLASGQERWSFEAANWVWSNPIVDAGRVYFGDFDGRIYAVDLLTGKEAWSLKLDKGPIRSAPALANGTLVVATEGGWLVGVDPSNQSKKWETQVNSGIAADVIVKGDTVYIAPKGCVKVGDSSEKAYYASVDPRTGELSQAKGVC